jgi:hypothetical protein
MQGPECLCVIAACLLAAPLTAPAQDPGAARRTLPDRLGEVEGSRRGGEAILSGAS